MEPSLAIPCTCCCLAQSKPTCFHAAPPDRPNAGPQRSHTNPASTRHPLHCLPTNASPVHYRPCHHAFWPVHLPAGLPPGRPAPPG
eukprot:3439997-Alexandrium_andersonii.AAC.1